MAKKSKRKRDAPCWEPETIPGLAKRMSVTEANIRMWAQRTRDGGPVPKKWPEPHDHDSSGKPFYDGRIMDVWWNTHPSNAKRTDEVDLLAGFEKLTEVKA